MEVLTQSLFYIHLRIVTYRELSPQNYNNFLSPPRAGPARSRVRRGLTEAKRRNMKIVNSEKCLVNSEEGLAAFVRGLISELQQVGKWKMAVRFRTTLNSLLHYTADKDVPLDSLTPLFILGYEEFMKRRGLCRNTTSYYMRNLRAIVNRWRALGAEVRNDLFNEVYLGIDRTVKRAVPIETVCRIRDLDLSGRPKLELARCLFLFSFYTRGMSLVDILFLKKSDVRNGVITYSRRKTRQRLQVRIESETLAVMERIGESNTGYLLPVISSEGEAAEKEYQRAYRRINRSIHKIGALIGMPRELTLYVARHSWASIAHCNNVPLPTISAAMGHDSEKTTLIYLRTLDRTSVDQANLDIMRKMQRIPGPPQNMAIAGMHSGASDDAKTGASKSVNQSGE